jgi:hypothetical protein
MRSIRLCIYLKSVIAVMPTATASSSRAAGRSRPNLFAKRTLALAPPNVAATAPVIPATRPRIAPPPESPIARPHKPLVTILVMNCGGINRLGVFGSLSLTSSHRTHCWFSFVTLRRFRLSRSPCARFSQFAPIRRSLPQNKSALFCTFALATSNVFKASRNSLIFPFSATRRAKKS